MEHLEEQTESLALIPQFSISSKSSINGEIKTPHMNYRAIRN